MLDRVSCPFCNATFRPAVTGGVPCPRCGETVPVSAAVSTEPPRPHGHIPAESVNGSGPYPSPSDPPAVARSLRPLAGIGLVMLLLVVGAGAVALFLRPAGPPPAPPKPPTTWPPAAVPGLAYLPADATVVAAIQPRAIKNYLDRTNSDPSAVVLPAEAGRMFDTLGLKADQVEAVVAGVVVRDNNLLPPLVVVVTVAPPFDEAAFWKAVKAERNPDAPGRYKADLNGLPVYAARAADGVFAFATRPADLDGLEARSGNGSPLSADLRESMARLSPASVAWAATGSAAWADKPELKLWAGLAKRPDAVRHLSGATAGAVGLALEPDPKLRAAVLGDESVKLKLADAVGEPMADGDWWTAERPIDPAPKK